MLFFASCEDYLEKSPDMGLTAEEVYSDYVTFEGTVDRAVGLLHNYVYDPYDYGSEVGVFSDECQIVKSNSIETTVNAGNWTDFSGSGMKWDMGIGEYSSTSSSDEWAYRWHWREVQAEAVVGIRSVNLALENMHLLQSFPEGSKYTPEELRAQLKGQCFLLRGWFYFMIIRDYGGMPDMRASYSTDEDFDVIRPEYLESHEWLIQDLDSAIHYLPEDWLDSPSEVGRATKTTARAIKSMALMYAASPNYNITRAESLGFSGDPMSKYNSDIATQGLAACVDAITSAESHPRYRMYSQSEYTLNFRQQNADGKGLSDEAIFQPAIRRVTGGNINGAGMYLPSWDASQDWANFSVPTQNAVDWYETADGWELGDNWHLGSGDAEDNSTVWSKDDPYANRDPRLKTFVFTHGDNMYIGDKAIDNTANNNQRKGLPPVCLVDNPNGAHYVYETQKGWNHTGFYHAGKYRHPGANRANNTSGYVRIFPFIRMAQLYLDFAEMANELYGPTGAVPGISVASGVTSAQSAINYVRARVGMPSVQGKYLASTEVFREYIRKERARELFYEQHRWWDLKRWRTAHTELSKGIWVADIAETGGSYSYSKKLSGYERVFENRNYWYPFHSNDMNLFKNFEQNPGW